MENNQGERIAGGHCHGVYIPANRISNVVGDYTVSWNEMLESSHKDDYFAELAIIYPKYNEDHNIQNSRFYVAVVQSGEGVLPHVHVYFEHHTVDSEESSAPIVAYISLHEATYAPQHRKNTRILDLEEKKALAAYFNTFRAGAYILDKNKTIVPCNCWRECVDIWVRTYGLPKGSIFQYDETGEFLMPDYNELK